MKIRFFYSDCAEEIKGNRQVCTKKDFVPRSSQNANRQVHLQHTSALLVLMAKVVRKKCGGGLAPILVWLLFAAKPAASLTMSKKRLAQLGTARICKVLHSHAHLAGTLSNSSDANVSAEVIGCYGRIGSLFLRHAAIPVPRGRSAGWNSDDGNPIFVATPAHSWRDVYTYSKPSRRTDLVWVGNGLPLPAFERSTVVVPHFGVLQVGESPVTSISSPPTYVYGKHTDAVCTIFQKEGVFVKVIDSWHDLYAIAARKVLWASVMWLVRHSETPPLTVAAAHKQKRQLLIDLVSELFAPLQAIVGLSAYTNEYEDTFIYLELYSMSMPYAIPNKQLAIDEIKERNGIWLSLSAQFPQELHQALVREVAGRETLDLLL